MLGVQVAAKTFQGFALLQPQSPPISTYIVKIFQLCNINCRYCYMYNLEDVSYINRPKVMSPHVRDQLIVRIREHAEAHKLSRIYLHLHGGEPLLAGKSYVDQWATALRQGLGDKIDVALSLQTNGTLLDHEWVEIFLRHRMRFGISIDGPKEFHDRDRVDHSGAGTFDRTLAGLRRVQEHHEGSKTIGGVLSVANPAVSPRAMWDFWLSLDLKKFEFLLPHYNHDQPPPFRQEAIAAWMIELFDLWWDRDDPELEVRYFRNIINLILGSDYSMDYLGGKPIGMVVVESDGAITSFDTLRSCDPGLIETGATVQTNTFDDAAAHPIFRLCNHSSAFVSAKCADCRVRDVCGGGYITNRYSRESGFNNPSVYCESIFALISHIEQRVMAALPRPYSA